MTRTRHARRALLAGLATLSLGLAACGDDDADSGDVTVVDDTASDDTSTDDTATESTATEGTTTESTAGLENTFTHPETLF